VQIIAKYQADRNRKHGQKINRTNALATVMDMMVPAFIQNTGKSFMPLTD
jgi:hypothetical protein